MENHKIIPYTEKEKILLANLVDKHNIVESKKTDSATMKVKNEMWEVISNNYNSLAGIITTKRNSVQLKKLWNNLKQRKRKATTEMKYSSLLTGGGPSIEYQDDPVMQAVDVAAPNADITIRCPWDSTAMYKKDIVTDSLNDENEDINKDRIIEGVAIPLDVDIPSTSASSSLLSPLTVEHSIKCTSTPSRRKTVTGGKIYNSDLLQKEANARIKKTEDAICHQEQLFQIRLKVEEEQLKAAIATRKKLEAEMELAQLKLKNFKEAGNK